MQRYFVNNDQIYNNKVVISDNDFHHIKNVMRMKEKNRVYIVDEDGNLFLCEIDQFFEKKVELNILEKLPNNSEMEIEVTVAMGLTKRDKQEEVIRRITELGAKAFLCVEMERSIVKIKEQKESKIDRQMMIVKEASEQSHRNKLMTIFETVNLKNLIIFSKNYDLKLFAYEVSGRKNDFFFKKVLQNFNGKSIIILTGPEGGISEKEAQLLSENGFIAVGLGPRILRCETAPLYVMSAISYELELKNES